MKHDWSESQISVIVANGGWFISVLWVPYYYCPFPPEVVYQKHTPEYVQSLFPETEKNPLLVVVADSKKITTNKTSDFWLQAILWSPKLKKFLFLKFRLFVAMDGRILYHSSLLGGNAEEITTFSTFPYFHDVTSLSKILTLYLVFNHRGSCFDVGMLKGEGELRELHKVFFFFFFFFFSFGGRLYSISSS